MRRGRTAVLVIVTLVVVSLLMAYALRRNCMSGGVCAFASEAVGAEEIVRLYKDVVDHLPKHPKSDEVLNLLVERYRKGGAGDEKEILLRIVEDFANSKIGIYAADRLFARKDIADARALRLVERTIGATADKAAGMRLFSLYLKRVGGGRDKARAIEFARAVISKQADEGIAFFGYDGLAKLYWGDGDFKSAAEVLEAMEQHFPERFLRDKKYAPLVTIYARTLSEKEIAKYERLLRLTRDEEAAYHGANYGPVLQLDYAVARLKVEKGLGSPEDKVKALFWEGYTGNDVSKLTEVVENYAGSPDSLRASLHLGLLHKHRGDTNGAEEDYLRCLRDAPPLSDYPERAVAELRILSGYDAEKMEQLRKQLAGSLDKALQDAKDEKSRARVLAKQLDMHRVFGEYEDYYRKGEKLMADFPDSPYAAEALKQMVIVSFRKSWDLEAAGRYGAMLVKKPSESGELQDLIVYALEANVMLRHYDTVLDMLPQALSEMSDEAGESRISMIGGLALLGKSLEELEENDTRVAREGSGTNSRNQEALRKSEMEKLFENERPREGSPTDAEMENRCREMILKYPQSRLSSHAYGTLGKMYMNRSPEVARDYFVQAIYASPQEALRNGVKQAMSIILEKQGDYGMLVCLNSIFAGSKEERAKFISEMLSRSKLREERIRSFGNEVLTIGRSEFPDEVILYGLRFLADYPDEANAVRYADEETTMTVINYRVCDAMTRKGTVSLSARKRGQYWGSYDNITELKRYIDRYPNTFEAAKAVHRIALIHEDAGNYSDALYLYHILRKDYSNYQYPRMGEKIEQMNLAIALRRSEYLVEEAEIYDSLGMSALLQDSCETVVRLSQEIMDKTKSSAARLKALENVSRVCRYGGADKEASSLLDKVISKFPNTEEAERAREILKRSNK